MSHEANQIRYEQTLEAIEDLSVEKLLAACKREIPKALEDALTCLQLDLADARINEEE